MIGCVLCFWISAALGVFPREKRALARFSRISIPIICGILCPIYIIYYYISVRTELYGGRIEAFVLRTRFLRCGFIAHSRFARRICLEFDSLLVFIGVCTLVRRTGSGVKIVRVCVSPDQIAIDLQLAHVLIECRAADSGVILCMLGRKFHVETVCIRSKVQIQLKGIRAKLFVDRHPFRIGNLQEIPRYSWLVNTNTFLICISSVWHNK